MLDKGCAANRRAVCFSNFVAKYINLPVSYVH